MHGMLFTHIQLDDFKLSIAWFKERLQLYASDGTDTGWTGMAVLSVRAMPEHGRLDGLQRRMYS